MRSLLRTSPYWLGFQNHFGGLLIKGRNCLWNQNLQPIVQSRPRSNYRKDSFSQPWRCHLSIASVKRNVNLWNAQRALLSILHLFAFNMGQKLLLRPWPLHVLGNSDPSHWSWKQKEVEKHFMFRQRMQPLSSTRESEPNGTEMLGVVCVGKRLLLPTMETPMFWCQGRRHRLKGWHHHSTKLGAKDVAMSKTCLLCIYLGRVELIDSQRSRMGYDSMTIPWWKVKQGKHYV